MMICTDLDILMIAIFDSEKKAPKISEKFLGKCLKIFSKNFRNPKVQFSKKAYLCVEMSKMTKFQRSLTCGPKISQGKSCKVRFVPDI